MTELEIFKRCVICGELFQGKLEEYEFLCSKTNCQSKTNRILHKIKQTRIIPPEYLDIYRKHEGLIYYCCRICGGLLVKKDGKPNLKLRTCRNHQTNYLAWGIISSEYLTELIAKNKELIIQKLKSINIPSELLFDFENTFTFCEECGSLVKYHDSLLSNDPIYITFMQKHSLIAIHHVFPVYKIAKTTELHYIFDKTNLKGLCNDCHKAKHRHNNAKMIMASLNNRKLDSFMKK